MDVGVEEHFYGRCEGLPVGFGLSVVVEGGGIVGATTGNGVDDLGGFVEGGSVEFFDSGHGSGDVNSFGCGHGCLGGVGGGHFGWEVVHNREGIIGIGIYSLFFIPY